MAVSWASCETNRKGDGVSPAIFLIPVCVIGLIIVGAMISSGSANANRALREARELQTRIDVLGPALARLRELIMRADGGQLLADVALEHESLRFPGWNQIPRPRRTARAQPNPPARAEQGTGQHVAPPSSASWFVQTGSGVLGPVASGFIVSGVQSGGVDRNAKVSRDGKTGWVPITDVREFSSLFAPQAKVVQPTQQPAADDPFAALNVLSPEQKLRNAVREALADGVVTDVERAQLQKLQVEFGIAADVVRRIVQEEQAKMG
jgi:hypothetical protein